MVDLNNLCVVATVEVVLVPIAALELSFDPQASVGLRAVRGVALANLF